VPFLSEGSAFGVTEKVTLPLPFPLALEVMMTHDTPETAVQSQAGAAATLKVPVPPEATKDWSVDEIV
jgi:hypothetical protein